MPAHITLLIPFTDSEGLDVGRTGEVEKVLARFDPIELSLTKTGYFDGPPSVLYLEPEPAHFFREMTQALVRSFPEHPPYGDASMSIVPHLTVATRLDRELLTALEVEVAASLPITASLNEVWLMEYAEHAWRRRNRFALGAVA